MLHSRSRKRWMNVFAKLNFPFLSSPGPQMWNDTDHAQSNLDMPSWACPEACFSTNLKSSRSSNQDSPTTQTFRNSADCGGAVIRAQLLRLLLLPS